MELCLTCMFSLRTFFMTFHGFAPYGSLSAAAALRVRCLDAEWLCSYPVGAWQTRGRRFHDSRRVKLQLACHVSDSSIRLGSKVICCMGIFVFPVTGSARTPNSRALLTLNPCNSLCTFTIFSISLASTKSNEEARGSEHFLHWSKPLHESETGAGSASIQETCLKMATFYNGMVVAHHILHQSLNETTTQGLVAMDVLP